MKTVIVAFMLLFNYLDTLPKLYHHQSFNKGHSSNFHQLANKVDLLIILCAAKPNRTDGVHLVAITSVFDSH